MYDVIFRSNALQAALNGFISLMTKNSSTAVWTFKQQKASASYLSMRIFFCYKMYLLNYVVLDESLETLDGHGRNAFDHRSAGTEVRWA